MYTQIKAKNDSGFLGKEIVVAVAGNWKGGEYYASEKPKHSSSCKLKKN